jgi:septal ring factor EnvC (AmiA/AmiB activator)
VTTAATVDAASLRSLGGAGSQLAELLARTVTDCICAALDPPCTPCEDTDVLLACLEVRDCTVVRICNAERDYVISGSALRYWLPSKLLHRGVEWFCCRPGPRRDAPPAETGRLAFSEAGFGTGEPVAAMPWDLLGLPEPARLLRDAKERVGAARAAPAVPQPPTAASQAAADATVEQIADLAARVAALTEQLTRTQAKLGETGAKVGETEAKLGETEARLGETEAKLGETEARLGETLRVTQADLGKTQASLSALGSRPPAQASQAPPRAAAARQVSLGEASARRRNSAAKRPAAEKPASPADSGGAAAGSGASETNDDT